MKWVRGVLVGVLALLAGVGLGLWWSAPEPPELRPPRDLRGTMVRLDRDLPRLLAESKVPGAAVAMVSEGEVIFAEGYGVADDHGTPVDGDTVFQAGSISKTVAAAAIVSRFGDRLDVPIADRLRGWDLPPGAPDPSDVTLRRLLSHTAGINVPGYLGTPPDQPAGSTVDSLAGRTGAEPVRQSDQPGSYRYSGGGYTIAQLFAESESGQPLARLVEQELLGPLRMDLSGYACGTEVAVGHDQEGLALPSYRYAEAAAAGLCGSAADLGKFAVWLASDDPVAVRLRTPADGTDGRYGLGVEIDHPSYVGHLGVNRGYYARLVVNPEQRFGVVVLTNGDHGDKIVEAVLRMIN